MSSRVSLKTIASQAGVSHVTVSLALRNHPKIPEKTRNKIKRIAEKLGYHRDPEYSVLMTRMRQKRDHILQGIIAWVDLHHPTKKTKRWLNYYRLLHGASIRALDLNYQIQRFDCGGGGYSPSRLNSILRSRGVQGIVISPPADGVYSLSLNWKHFAAVIMGNCQFTPQLSRVYFSEYENMFRVLEEIRNHGYQKVGLVISQGSAERVHFSWSSAYLGFTHHFSKISGIPILDGNPHVDQDQFIKWFKTHRPEVVVANEYPIKKWLESMGEQVPQTVGHVRMDTTPEGFDENNQYIKESNWKRNPRDVHYTGINQEHEQMGATAVDTLLAKLYQGEYGISQHPKTVVIRGSWVKGETLLPYKRFKKNQKTKK